MPKSSVDDKNSLKNIMSNLERKENEPYKDLLKRAIEVLNNTKNENNN